MLPPGSKAERAVYTRTSEIAAVAKVDLTRRKLPVLISEIMRLSQAGDPVVGVWEVADQRIVIRRDQLDDLARYVGILLHEIGHMVSAISDGTLDFENELSRLLDMTASAALGQRGRRELKRRGETLCPLVPGSASEWSRGRCGMTEPPGPVGPQDAGPLPRRTECQRATWRRQPSRFLPPVS